MTDARGDAALALAVMKLLSEQVRAARDRATQGVLTNSPHIGERTAAVLPDGTEVGMVSICRGRLTPKVTDMAELLEWVKKKHPTEVVTVEQVRPAFLTKILARVKDNGEAIPGTDLSRGDPYTSTALTEEGAKAVAAAWADGSLPLHLVVQPELEAGQ
jgi:hypothetical protein